LLILSAVDVRGQSSARLIRANAVPVPDGKGWNITVVFDTDFNTDNSDETSRATNKRNYEVVNIDQPGKQIPDDVQFANVDHRVVKNKVVLTVNDPNALIQDGRFHLYISNLTFDSKPPSEPLELRIQFKSKPPSSQWGLASSKGRNDSDLYGSYELTKARGIATTGTGDLKISIPFRADFWNRIHTISPVVDFKASSDAGADPDSLKFALEWFWPIADSSRKTDFPYTSVALINSGKVEAPKNFDNVNALWEGRWLFQSSHFSVCNKIRCFLDPFVGHELGKNLRSPLKSAEGAGLFRLFVGADLTLQFPLKIRGLKGFEFDSSYVRRWPLRRELFVKKDDESNSKPFRPRIFKGN
jgi:hypothetical protein